MNCFILIWLNSYKETIDLNHFDPIFYMELWFESFLWWFESIFILESMIPIIGHGYRINFLINSYFNFSIEDSNKTFNESDQKRNFNFILSQNCSYLSHLYMLTSTNSFSLNEFAKTLGSFFSLSFSTNCWSIWPIRLRARGGWIAV